MRKRSASLVQKSFLSFAKERKTTYEFSNKNISDNDLLKILEAGRWAPSAANSQPWNFIVVRDKRIIGDLVDTATYGFFHTKPILIIALVLKTYCSCLRLEHRVIRDSKLSIVEGHLSIAMPALNMVYEAQDLGIQSCFLTPEEKSARRILKIKKTWELNLLVGFGYGKKIAFKKPRLRLPLQQIIFNETHLKHAKFKNYKQVK